jgi:ribosomal subunit interface protein
MRWRPPRFIVRFMVTKPVEIRFLDLAPSEALEGAARAKAAKLEQFHRDLMSCRVTIERQHKHHHQGQSYAVRVDVTWPGHELSVDRVHNEDVYVALRDAFDDMKRRLEDATHRDRGQEKAHAVPIHGEVVRLSAGERLGFIRTPEGDEYWFDAQNVADVPFEHVTVGAKVQFLPEVAASGRQAKRVSLGKHQFG